MKKWLTVFLGVVVLAGAGLVLLLRQEDSYSEVISFRGGGVKITLYSKDGRIKSGGNRIKVVLDPPRSLKEFYLYMPPMPGMDEMRSVASLREKERGVYTGSLNVSMDGPWQIRAVFEGGMAVRDVFIPLTGEDPTEAAHSKATHTEATHEHPEAAHAKHIKVPLRKLQLLGVVTEPVRRRHLSKIFSTVGYVSYDLSSIYDVTVRADAWVEDTFGRFEGEFVRKGDPLMRVLSPDIQIALDELRLAQEKGDEELIRKAKEKLAYLKIEELVRSPVSGVILERKVFEGGYVKEGQTAYRIADISTVWIVAEVPLKLGRYVRRGTRALVIPEEDPGKAIPGKVDYIFPEADPLAKTLRVRIKAPNRGLALKPNALVDVRFEVPLGSVLAVPETAVVDTGRRTVVFVEKEAGVFAPVRVHLGRRAEGFYEVKHGLREGDRVVVRGSFLLDSEAQIRGLYGEPAGGGHHH